MSKITANSCIPALHERLGIEWDDCHALRRIAMTLHKWFEDECGDSNDRYSKCLTRGHKKNGHDFEYDDNGRPYWEVHWHNENKARYVPTPDRETGACKRLAKIMAKYPGLVSYIQTDPRGAPLYILQSSDIPAGAKLDSCYSRGVAVYK